ncbi:hypothetical protein BO78DRAFT_78255 [Aspergillus sclerotiicarbonarius CBS 121057]|uniref:Uncharacterized protein n=1 Tax=Aspergillus sclerotiicarbonarius (strain CBS 121057 / IBT 28362) TaxID=1448318 RepID=A0A319FJY3_ASPSB|nr:hypothetical protein BO78DRAFT_78255 [Aspergillus sclerotiicarbonarius CBS 121057]
MYVHACLSSFLCWGETTSTRIEHPEKSSKDGLVVWCVWWWKGWTPDDDKSARVTHIPTTLSMHCLCSRCRVSGTLLGGIHQRIRRTKNGWILSLGSGQWVDGSSGRPAFRSVPAR